MVYSKSLLSTSLLLLLNCSFSAATEMNDNTGPVTKAVYNPENGDADLWRAPATAEKRDYSYNYGYDSYGMLISSESNRERPRGEGETDGEKATETWCLSCAPESNGISARHISTCDLWSPEL
jgi:hypothetical protein